MKKQLKEAAKSHTLIRLWRDDFDSGPTTGFVVGVGREWCLFIDVTDEVTFNGFTALRLKDISEIEPPDNHLAFIEKALQLKKLKEPEDPGIDLADTGSLVISVGRAFPVVTLSLEKIEADTCQVGMPVQVQAGSVSLMEIDAHAVWHDDVEFYPLADITRVDFGGGYEEALTLVGGSN